MFEKKKIDFVIVRLHFLMFQLNLSTFLDEITNALQFDAKDF